MLEAKKVIVVKVHLEGGVGLTMLETTAQGEGWACPVMVRTVRGVIVNLRGAQADDMRIIKYIIISEYGLQLHQLPPSRDLSMESLLNAQTKSARGGIEAGNGANNWSKISSQTVIEGCLRTKMVWQTEDHRLGHIIIQFGETMS